MKITIEINDELVDKAQEYELDLTLDDAKNIAKSAITSKVIQAVTSKIKEDGDADTQELVNTKIQEIINIIKE